MIASIYSKATFTCRADNANILYWKLNGIRLNKYNSARTPRNDILTELVRIGRDIIGILTINVRRMYNETKFQCVAGPIGRMLEEESKNATLTVKGTV